MCRISQKISMIKNYGKVRLLGLLIAIMPTLIYSSISVKAFSREESGSQTDLSTPRIYIQNTGTETINSFECFYYFSAVGKQPVLDQNYTDGATVTVDTIHGNYRVRFAVNGINLAANGIYPNSSGWSVGLHNSDWSTWDKTDDYSQNMNSTFVENNKILVFINGLLVYGVDPYPPDVSITTFLEITDSVTGASVLITPDGNLKTTLETQEKLTSLPADKFLSIESNGETKLIISNSLVGAADEIRANMITAPPSGDLVFLPGTDESSVPAAAVGAEGNGTDGDLMLKGSVFGQKTFTAYIDDFGVFDRGGNGAVQFTYSNIVSPYGVEGRVIYEDGEETSARQFYIKDHLGSARQVIDDEGNTVEAVSYQPYGTMVSLNQTAEMPVREKFTGKEFDTEGDSSGIGLYDFGARLYDPDAGIFASVDPLEEFFNVYSYTGQNPINFIDPTGMGLEKTGYEELEFIDPPEDQTHEEDQAYQTGTRNTGIDGDFALEINHSGNIDFNISFNNEMESDGLNFDFGQWGGSSTSQLPQLSKNAIKTIGAGLEALKTCFKTDKKTTKYSKNDAVNVDMGNSASNSGGIDLLRSPRFDADGNIQLNRRGLLGAFGVPIAGGIVGAGTATTLGVTGLYLGAPAIGSNVIVPTAKFAYQHRATIQAVGEALIPTPYPIAKNLPELGAATLLGAGSWIYDNWGSSSGFIAPATNPFAPDATRIGW